MSVPENLDGPRDPRDPHDPEDPEAIAVMANDSDVARIGVEFLEMTYKHKYYYNFKWLGRPIVQYPQDIIALQETVWNLKPTLIVETGVAHGGSLILYASLLEIIGEGRVLGIEIELRDHNRKAIVEHPMAHRIDLLDGSSVDPAVIGAAFERARGHERVMVVLDSYHTHEHVVAELRAYAPMVKKGGSLVVFGTSVAKVGSHIDLQRAWTNTRNPKTALDEFLLENTASSSIERSPISSCSPTRRAVTLPALPIPPFSARVARPALPVRPRKCHTVRSCRSRRRSRR